MLLKSMKRQSDYVFLKNIHQPCEATDDEEEILSGAELDEAGCQGLLGRHVYAMGGVTMADLAALRTLGFGGVVIRNDLWNRFCIHSEQNFSPVIEHFRRLRAFCQ